MKPVLIEESTPQDIPEHLHVLLLSIDGSLSSADGPLSFADKNDVIVAVLYVLMLETGFLPQHEVNSLLCASGHGFNVQTLRCLSNMPPGWKNTDFYELTFGLGTFPRYACKLLVMPLSDALVVNLVIPHLDKERRAYSMTIQPSKYITDLSTDIPSSFKNLQVLSLKFKDNISTPAKCAILTREGMLNPSLLGLPDEVKIRIFKDVTIKDMSNISLSCRKLFALSKDQSIWRHYVSRDFHCVEAELEHDPIIHWKKLQKKLFCAQRIFHLACPERPSHYWREKIKMMVGLEDSSSDSSDEE